MAARLLFVALAVGLFGGACSTGADHQRLPIGSACNKDSDCGTTPYLCLLQTSVNGSTVTYPNGYCSLPCVAATTDCPSDSTCVVGECRRLCGDASDCRVDEGYACEPADTNGAGSTFCDYPKAI